MVNYVSKIGLGAATGTLNIIVSVIGGIITVPLLLFVVGVEDYGLFIVISSVIGFVGLGNLGMPTAITNQVSYFWAEKKKQEISELFSGSFYFLGIIVLAIWALIIGFFYLDLLPMEFIFGVSHDLVPLATILFTVLLIFGTANIFFGSILSSLFNGLNEIPYYNGFQFVYQLIYIVSFISFLYFYRPTIIEVALFQGALMMARLVALYLVALRKFYWFRFHRKFSNIRRVFPLLKHSLNFFILSLSTSLIGKTDLLVLSHTIGVTSAPLFSINDKIFRIPTSAAKIADPAVPSIASFFQLKNFGALQTLYHQLIRMHLIIRITILAFMAVYAKEIITVWVGTEFFHNYWLVLLFCISYLIYSWVGPHFVFLNSMFKHKAAVIPMIINVIINLTLSIILAKTIGIIGIVIGTVAGNLLTNAIYIPFYLSKQIQIKPFLELFKVVSRFIIPIGALILFYQISTQFFEQSYVILLSSVVNFCVFGALVTFLVFTDSERSFLYGKIVNKLKSFRNH